MIPIWLKSKKPKALKLLFPVAVLLCALDSATTPGRSVDEPRPPRPVLTGCAAPADSARGFLHGVRPSHIWSSPFPAAFFFPSIIVFSKELRLLRMCPN